MLQLTKKEKEIVSAFCAPLCEIVGPTPTEPAEQTALEEANRFFGTVIKQAASNVDNPLRNETDAIKTGKTGRLILGQVSTNPEIAALCRAGVIKIDTVDAMDDAYQLCCHGDDIIIAGANHRAVLHGVYALEDKVIAGEGDAIDCFVVPHFRKRSDALGHYHSVSVNLGNDTVDEPKAEYLARLGINQFCACFDGSPYGSFLSDLVHSDVFPFQKPVIPEAVQKIKDISHNCRKYGIDFHMMVWEPAVPAMFAPLEAYPPEVLGTVHRPYGGDENGLQKTLCISHPMVQAHYTDLVTKFVTEFTDVAGFFFYNMDGNTWLCTPALCPRCRAKVVSSDPELFNPWETQALLVDTLSKAAHAVRPDFAFNLWGTIHMNGDSITNLYRAADDYDTVTTGSDGDDHNIHINFPLDPPDAVHRTFAIAKEKKKPLYIYYAYNRLEAVQIGFPSPYTVAKSIRTFKEWGADNLMEVTGPTAALNQITALAMKQFQTAPDTDIDTYLAALANAQFGPEAGPHALQAWKYADIAYDSWLGYEASPLGGSQFFMRVSTFYGKIVANVLPETLADYEQFYYNCIGLVEYWRKYQYYENETQGFTDRFANMEHYISLAAEELQKAYELTPADEYIGICYYPGSFEGSGRQTMREYARLNLSAGQQMQMNCRMKLNVIHALHFLRILRDGTEEQKTEANIAYRQLIKEDITLKEQYAELLRQLIELRPCLTLTGICKQELESYLDDTLLTIAAQETWLRNNS